MTKHIMPFSLYKTVDVMRLKYFKWLKKQKCYDNLLFLLKIDFRVTDILFKERNYTKNVSKQKKDKNCISIERKRGNHFLQKKFLSQFFNYTLDVQGQRK